MQKLGPTRPAPSKFNNLLECHPALLDKIITFIDELEMSFFLLSFESVGSHPPPEVDQVTKPLS